MKASKPNGLAILGAKDGQFPKRAISLLEIMREFDAANFFQLDRMLEEYSEKANKPQGVIFVEQELQQFRIFSNFYLPEGKFEELGWNDTETRSLVFKMTLWGTLRGTANKKTVSAESIQNCLRDIQLAIQKELRFRKFVMIEKNKSEFLEQKNLFGKQVAKAFPSACDEIKAAGNCLAMDLNTAAVFHLMRVAELGMRALARRLKVKCKKNTIDSGGWSEIITGIENATAARWLKAPKAKIARRKAVAFLKLCEISADELNVFKEVWRNNVMHAGQLNNEHEAHGVYIRVRDFMQRLSMQVSEPNS
jgi:hypothetical protein